MKLYEIADELKWLDDKILASEGELTAEDEVRLEELKVEWKAKIRSIVGVIKALKGDQILLDLEMERLKKISEAKVRNERWLRDYLRDHLEVGKTVDLATCKVQWGKTKVLVIDADKVPDQYKKTVITKEIDKRKIAKALDEAELDFAHRDVKNFVRIT